jgi:hypothetical protein
MRNNDIPLDGMISQEKVLDVFVFGSIMLTMVVRNLDDTLIVTKEGNFVHSVTIVLWSLSHPKKMSTTTTGCDILCLGRG